VSQCPVGADTRKDVHAAATPAASPAATEESRADIYQRITDRIAAAIEAGAGEWRMPWHPGTDGAAPVLPVNAVTGKPYRGVNTVVLWATAQAEGYPGAVWATYRQWQELGAQSRKGEQSSPVVFWKISDTDEQDEGEDSAGSDGEDGRRSRVFARLQRVQRRPGGRPTPGSAASCGPPSPASAVVSPSVVMARTMPAVACWMPATCPEIVSAAFAVCCARSFTSATMTAKPRPASPAPAASMVAFSASRLVCPAMRRIRSVMLPIREFTMSIPQSRELPKVPRRLGFSGLERKLSDVNRRGLPDAGEM